MAQSLMAFEGAEITTAMWRGMEAGQLPFEGSRVASAAPSTRLAGHGQGHGIGSEPGKAGIRDSAG